ncbi:unnamed protein product [Rhizoctonia solani]|uniref:Uncharacterized protein n=1 Tax=Rhizoctonia solani TaxID=456999 RepID=A0A8H2WFS9_9AGAM|nr:unnamed protein product [Rhizoctonia solani]
MEKIEQMMENLTAYIMPSGAASKGRAPSVRSLRTDNGPAPTSKQRTCIETITEDAPVTSTPRTVLECYINSIGEATIPLDMEYLEDNDALSDKEELELKLEDKELVQGPIRISVLNLA